MKERKLLQEMTKISVLSAPSVEEAVRLAFENANKSTKVLFSPGFAAGGIDSCRKDRGERFMRAVRTL
jgi:UDP-N-acetylmuramoylalanine-D-glutamate ligase